MSAPVTGGCQCGAVRFTAERLGRSNFCHCRMCQRATGNAFAPLVTAHGLTWAGTPARFASSDVAERLFCARCGTPVGAQWQGAETYEVMLGALDDPAAANPEFHYGIESRVPWLHLSDGWPEMATQPGGPSGAGPKTITSYQDPAALAAKEDQ